MQSIPKQRKHLSDDDYLKQENIGLVISQGLGVLYRTNPHNPVDFLAKWLFNHRQVVDEEEK
jgi:hypothetical protein